MDIRKLEVFCKVVEYKSFTKAAQWAMISQPTVSEHIRSLEQQVDQRLIDRLGRKVEATPVGQLLYNYALKIIRLQEESMQAIEVFSGNLIGRILIGSSTIPGTYILPHLLGRFIESHPEIKANINIDNSRTIAQKVIAGEYDLGIIGATWNERSLAWTEVFADELTVVMRPDHPLAKKEELTIDDLLQEPFIFREHGSGTRKVIAGILEQQGYRENSLQEVAVIGTTAAVKQAIKAGIGISILSLRAILEDIRHNSLVGRPLKGMQMQRPFYLIQRRNRELSPVAAVFVEYILQQADDRTDFHRE
ncbi:selenium metabolism-associated LysR family transcriptional regulator [Desulfogranum japonicum]|uniref:selenium metabolism-associated LysR family transcriptional regulator n=1 Tax=Desulfogranum japonicum TaxID=231447 RepID=UPI00040F3263|nr:selenium metabolism-associated LysR family transcriptional regulator [Desulfogranum japonicum]